MIPFHPHHMPQIDRTKKLLPTARNLHVPLLEVLSEGPYLAKVFRPSGTAKPRIIMSMAGRFRRFSGWRRQIHQGQIVRRSRRSSTEETNSPQGRSVPSPRKATIHDGPGAIWRSNVVKDTSSCLSSFDPNKRSASPSGIRGLKPSRRWRSKEQSGWKHANRDHRPWIHGSNVTPNHRPPRPAP